MTDDDVALLVVGSGPAGLEAARAYRDHGGDGRVLMLTADEHPPYFRPPLTKEYLRGEMDEDELWLEDAAFYGERGIDLVPHSHAVALDPRGRRLRTEAGGWFHYRSCVLATGSAPLPLSVPGGDHPDVRLLRSRRQGAELRKLATDASSAVVVGSGFIGCEAASSLRTRGCTVTVVSRESLPQQHRLGEEVAARIAGWLADDGIRVLGGVELTSVDDGRVVHTSDGSRTTADLVLAATGVEPDTTWVRTAGVDCRDGRVLTDSGMATSVPGLYAAGDVALAHNESAGRRLAVEHWGDAVRMGEVAGARAAGADERWAEVPGFWSDVGGHVLKYQAWGDGHDASRFVAGAGGAFTVWYGRDDVLVGVLTHDADADAELAGGLVRDAAPFPER